MNYLWNIIVGGSILMGACTHAHATERVKHYMAEQPKNVQAAIATLHADTQKIALLMAKNPTLDPQALEAIHEISYQLEASQKTLAKHPHTRDAAKALHEPIERLHEESEEHDAKATVQAFEEMQQVLQEQLGDKVASKNTTVLQ